MSEFRRAKAMYAVLGATGKVGREVVSVLKSAGKPVRAILRDPASIADPSTLSGCEIVQADVRDPAALSAAIAGADAVHVIAPVGRPGQDGPTELRRAIRAVTEAIGIAKPARVLALSDYGAQHARGTGLPEFFHEWEGRLSDTGVDLVLLRSAEHMENWGRIVGRLAAGGKMPSMHHPVLHPFPTVAARDVGRIAGEILLEIWRPGRRIVHVEGPRRYSAEDVAGAFSRLMGQEIDAVPLPRDEWIPTLRAAGLTEGTARQIAAFFDACNAGLIDIETGVGEVRLGTTPLLESLRALVQG